MLHFLISYRFGCAVSPTGIPDRGVLGTGELLYDLYSVAGHTTGHRVVTVGLTMVPGARTPLKTGGNHVSDQKGISYDS